MNTGSKCATELLSKVKLEGKTVLGDKAIRELNRRHIATRYDKLAVCFLNFVILSALLIQL